MVNLDSFLPSDEWQHPQVHWHAFAVASEPGSPEAVLRSPWEVARWIDEQTRKRVYHRKVWASREGVWVAIGDEDDLEHLREENFGIASRGDSIHTDIYSESGRHEVYVEAVIDEQCRHNCDTRAAR